MVFKINWFAIGLALVWQVASGQEQAPANHVCDEACLGAPTNVQSLQSLRLRLQQLKSSNVTVKSAPSETFSHQITHDGETVVVDFVKFSNRGPLFEVVTQQPDGTFLGHTPDEVRTYLGTSSTHTGVTGSAIVRADGSIIANVTFQDGSEWTDVDGTVSTRGSTVTPRLPQFTVRQGGAGSNVHAIDMLIDLPYPQILACGGTAATALEMAEFSMARTNALYLRDASIINRIGRVVLRMDEDADPYQGMTTTGQLLSQVKIENDSFVNQPDDHDLIFVASVQVGGGLANVGVIGSGASSNGSSSNGDFSVVGRHEIGHNWSLSHFDGGTPEGATINSGNSLGKMSGPEVEKVLLHRDNRLSHIDQVGNISPELPPRAAEDVYTIEVESGNHILTPLVNDNDVNGSALTLVSVSPSLNGIVPTIDPNNANQIIISAPTHFSSGTDSFSYIIEDEAGNTSEARVHIDLTLSANSIGHWTFERRATEAVDSTANLTTGTLEGDAQITNSELVLNGTSDYVDVPTLSAVSNTVTYSAMVYRDGDQSDFAGLIFSRSSEAFGLNLGTNNELRGHWDDSGDWGFNSGLQLPDQTWAFVAMVVEPHQTTFYMDPGTGMQTVVNTTGNQPRDFSIGTQIGRDSRGGRLFQGKMDDVRLFDFAMSAGEINNLAAGGFGSRSPLPIGGDDAIEGVTELRWQSSPLATSERLFVSRSYSELRDAVVGSPADKGLVTGGLYSLPTEVGSYYWRVDSIENGELVKGEIWTFNAVPYGELSHWRLNETGGTSAIDGIGESNGVVFGDPVFSSTGSQFSTGTSYQFSGNDYIEVPYQSALNPDQFSVTAWAKVTGGEGSFRSVITSRDSSKGFVIYANSSNQWSFWVNNGSSWRQHTSSETINLNQWYHLAATYDGETASLYVDGVLAAQSETSFVPNDSKPLRIGSGNTEGSPNYNFVGCIDEVKMWSRSLSTEEIQASDSSRWLAQYALNSTLPTADQDNDGLTLLEEYAYGLNPTVADAVPISDTVSSTMGIPLIRLIDGRLQIEYLRRRNDSSLVYQPQFGNSVDALTPFLSEQSVTPVSGLFERVVVIDSGSVTTHPKRFARVVVEF